ncbi:unnamed protein product [Mytilus coruscus]|uniref:Reverse transcriptase n=1 Tax=Mytilus coruscus TaxID=42192 RepID=A0A6J8AEX2_MYTCO|nr:unnamed protein product [Mytilus coruscus]
MKKNKCLVDVSENIFHIDNLSVPLIFQGTLGCFRVVSTESVTIPARSEIVVSGKVCLTEGQTLSTNDVLVEASENKGKDYILTARSIVKSNVSKPVRLMNVENEANTIFPGTIIAQITSDKLSRSEKQKVKSLVQEYGSLFAETDSDLGKTSLVKHEIETGNARPFKEPPRRTPFHLSKVVNDNIDKMLENKVIESSHSPWAAGIVLVRKKDDTYRFFVDYRKLNSVTINKDAYPLSRIDESLDHLAGNSWFSTLDCFSGYWEVELAEKDKHKTAFATKKKGLFKFKVMPFGLCCAAQTFERLMETFLAGLQWEICLVYLDDVIVFGKTLDDMLINSRTVFDRLKSAGLKLKAKKCNLCVTMVRYLGHIISEDGIATDPEKIKVVQNWPVPTNHTEVRSFLDTDASNVALGGVLSQRHDDGKEKVIAYASRSMSKSERRYCVTRKDLLAVVYFVKYFNPYFYGRKFTIKTDHNSLRWLLNFKNPEGQVARWIETLSAYDMHIQHPPGTQHRNADALSRIPCKQCGYTSDWQSKMSSDCPRTEESQVKIVTSQMPDHARDLTLTDIQSNDLDLKQVKQWLIDGQRPLYNEVSGKGFFIRSLWSQFNSLELQDDLVFRHFDDKERKVVKLQAVIPLSERTQVLHYCNDAKYAGHLVMRKTLEKIRQSYYWPGLQADVRTYVAGCDKCAMRKTPTKKKRAPMAIVETSSPMERLATDILGELSETENGNRYILVVSDNYTKSTESFPMPNMEASTVVKIIVEEVIARFGVPSWIHFDKGRQYESRLFQENIKETPQIIHVERIKLKHKQVLGGEMYEDIDNPQVTEPREIDKFDNVIDQDDKISIEEESGRRERKRPVWMADYILD